MSARRLAQSGFSLTELMIAVALGLIVLASLTSFFVSTSSTRREIDRASRQIENGRFAVDAIRQEVRLAGFYADLDTSAANWQTPDPCVTASASQGIQAMPGNQLPVPFFGYGTDAVAPACVADREPGTEVMVIRRFNTESVQPGVAVAGNPYVQISRCANDSSLTPWFFDDGGNAGTFSLRQIDCASRAPVWRHRVVIFYVRTFSLTPGDGVKTLVRIDLDAAAPGGLRTSELVEGIRDLRFEYGVDTDSDGAPNEWDSCLAAAPCNATRWSQVTAVRMHVLAENLEDTLGYTDKKEYKLGTVVVGPFGDMRKRHVYSTLSTAYNRAGLREQ
jgi:type IV pilus assembly protein PilW